MRDGAKVAVVTGGNRGIGLEIVRRLASDAGFHVILGSRDLRAGERAKLALGAGKNVEAVTLDVTSDADVRALAAKLKREGGVDAVINNAGTSMQGFDGHVAEETLAVNFFGALRVTDALLPLLRPHGRIVMVSSGMGDRSVLAPSLHARFDHSLQRGALVALMEKFVADVKAGVHTREGWPSSAYSVSKIGLTALAGVIARELQASRDPRHILCNAACPGWVRTRMGGKGAPRSVEEGADTPVWLATLPDDGPNGEFIRDRRPVDW